MKKADKAKYRLDKDTEGTDCDGMGDTCVILCPVCSEQYEPWAELLAEHEDEVVHCRECDALIMFQVSRTYSCNAMRKVE